MAEFLDNVAFNEFCNKLFVIGTTMGVGMEECDKGIILDDSLFPCMADSISNICPGTVLLVISSETVATFSSNFLFSIDTLNLSFLSFSLSTRASLMPTLKKRIDI